jgi:gas vesicle protein
VKRISQLKFVLVIINLNTEIMKDNSGSILLALVTGAVVGAGFGILYAPNKGVETRHKIKDKAKDAKEDLKNQISHAKDELTQMANNRIEVFEQKLEDTISNMSYKADDIIVSLEHKLEDLKKKNAQLHK